MFIDICSMNRLFWISVWSQKLYFFLDFKFIELVQWTFNELKVQRTNRFFPSFEPKKKYSMNVQWTFIEHFLFNERSLNSFLFVHWTFNERSLNVFVQWTFIDWCSLNVRWTFIERFFVHRHLFTEQVTDFFFGSKLGKNQVFFWKNFLEYF